MKIDYTQEEFNEAVKNTFHRMLSYWLLQLRVQPFIAENFDLVEFPNWQGRCTEDITMTAELPERIVDIRPWVNEQVLRVIGSILFSERYWSIHYFKAHTIVMKPDAYVINGKTFTFSFMLVGASIFYYYDPLLRWAIDKEWFNSHYKKMGAKNRIEMREKFGRCDGSCLL